MASLKLEIVTPHEVTYSEEVDMVVIPGIEGEMGIMPQHLPLLTQLKPGELIITKSGKESFYAVGAGIVKVEFESVSILTDMAVEDDAINEQEVEAALARAEEALKSGGQTTEEVSAVEATIQRSLAKLNVKRRRRI